MAAPLSEEDEYDQQFRNICFNMGIALVEWQRLEDQHYGLFRHLTGIQRQDLASIVYHSTESFDARRVMVGHLARAFIDQLNDKQQAKARRQIAAIDKGLADASKNRNKIAHHAMEYKISSMKENDDGSITIEYGPPRLQQSSSNILSRIEGRGPDQKGHDLGVTELQTYRDEFKKVQAQIIAFNHWLALVTPPQPLQSGAPQST